MKSLTRSLITLLACALLVACSTSTTEPLPPTSASSEPSDPIAQSDLENTWNVVSVEHLTVPPDIVATITFRGREVSGTSGCNTYGGSFTTDGSQLTLGPLRSTMMACEGLPAQVEGSFLAALDQTTSYAIEGTQLELSDKDGNPVLEAELAAPTPVGNS